jgi:hypothetical protein
MSTLSSVDVAGRRRSPATYSQFHLDLYERDLDPRRGALLIRSGKGDRRREVGMDDWGWEHLTAWVAKRAKLPPGPLFCIIAGPTRGRPWPQTGVRRELRRLATQAASAGASRRTSSGTSTPSSWPARACR